MPHKDRDSASIYDMLDAARSVSQIILGVSFHSFISDRKLYRAVEREIEIIGEAANRVSEALKTANQDVPWAKIIGTRHRLAHEYDEIRLEIIYRIATVHLADLTPQLERMLASLPPPSR